MHSHASNNDRCTLRSTPLVPSLWELYKFPSTKSLVLLVYLSLLLIQTNIYRTCLWTSISFAYLCIRYKLAWAYPTDSNYSVPYYFCLLLTVTAGYCSDQYLGHTLFRRLHWILLHEYIVLFIPGQRVHMHLYFWKMSRCVPMDVTHFRISLAVQERASCCLSLLPAFSISQHAACYQSDKENGFALQPLHFFHYEGKYFPYTYVWAVLFLLQ